ncbi:ER degradation-enhancing alpha-mannosidase-like protein 3 [Eurytemora carolleeae]|uniref:ER degradation-enhancing alpha-mannosidase-like protein 3 n=1 Tax=Eurytemora carolleeae TaxID=1294199 RepID=UPI000C77922A|nr:ER degradation-enhancing alpha-mannosidase-like protein 3 [Eurytemora carolleeae]|eukprot:XP_023336355.1 ER degradation-enhancing alpha-mannosidase-like protein 3 [Eurytemora affinis]
MILEFAALSRLSGESVFEEVASKAMDYLWTARNRQSNLVGAVLNVNTGDWVRRESGVGAGIDSYYEYVAKAYVLLGEDKYLDRWNTHYSAVMKYMNNGPLMVDVHMHRPTTNSKHFVDALGAFLPGLQVLMGDLKPAIEQHEILYQVTKKHNFLPEAITADFQVHWGQHFLRPEFVESTYFLYKATKDPHYLQVGKKVLKALQTHARVTCGYAAVKDVRTMTHEDRLDSFVLSETFKYLYLLFAKEDELYLDINQFVFTTEAHLLPLSLARLSNSTVVPVKDEYHQFLPQDEDVEFALSCPSTRYMFPDHSCSVTAATSLRAPLGNVVEDSSPKIKIFKRRLLASEFQSGNPEHLNLVKEMGINLQSLPDGRIQLLHTFANALSQDDAEEGLLFMQEMIDLSKQVQSQDSPPKQVTYSQGASKISLQAGPAQFGPSLKHPAKVTGRLVLAQDSKACIGSLQNGEDMKGNIVLVERGDCMFIEKARVIQSMGGIGGIVMDTAEGSAASASPIFAMSGDGSDDVSIPMVFLFSKEADELMKVKTDNPDLEVTLEEKSTSQKSGKACMANQKSDEMADLIYQNMESAKIYWFSNNRFQCSYLQYYKNKIILDPESPLSILQRDIRFLGINYGQILNPDLPTRKLHRDVKLLGVNHGPVIRLDTPDNSELSDIETDLDKLRNEVQSRFEELNEKLILFRIKQRVQGIDNEDNSKLDVPAVPSEEEDSDLLPKSPAHAFLHKSIETQLNLDELTEPDGEIISIKTVGSEIISEQIRTVSNKDGSSKTFRTIQRHTNDDLSTVVGVGTAKLVEIPRIKSTQDTPDTKDTQDTPEIKQVFSLNTEDPLGELVIDHEDVLEEEVVEEVVLSDTDENITGEKKP